MARRRRDRSGGLPARLLARLSEGFDARGLTTRGTFAAVLAVALGLVALHLWGAATGLLPRWAEIVLILAMAGMIPVTAGHLFRRLNDLDWPGWVAWGAVLPYANLALGLVLALRPTHRRAGRRDPGPLREVAMIGVVLLGLVWTLRIWWAPVIVTDDAMAPAYVAGDVVLMRQGAVLPARGAVIVLGGRGEPLRLSRAIGLPGETLALTEGVPSVDGIPADIRPQPLHVVPFLPAGPDRTLPRCANGAVGTGADCVRRSQLETLPDGTQVLTLDIADQDTDDLPPVTVPAGHVFALGDNRDDSPDSRLSPAVGGLGLVEVSRIRGIAGPVVLSLRGASPLALWTLRPDRVMTGTP